MHAYITLISSTAVTPQQDGGTEHKRKVYKHLVQLQHIINTIGLAHFVLRSKRCFPTMQITLTY
jgi:hypothetical protein